MHVSELWRKAAPATVQNPTEGISQMTI